MCYDSDCLWEQWNGSCGRPKWALDEHLGLCDEEKGVAPKDWEDIVTYYLNDDRIE